MTIRIRHVVAAMVTFVALAATLWSPAHAEDIVIKVRVQNTPEDGGKKQPVEGVTVEVLDAVGLVLDTGETDAKGVVDLTVPGPGTFTVKLDSRSLPEGLALPADDTGERLVTPTEGLGGNAELQPRLRRPRREEQARAAAADVAERRAGSVWSSRS